MNPEEVARAVDALVASGLEDVDPAGSEPLLRVRDLGKRFGGLQAVDEMTLDVRPATIHAVIGPDGAGKSTLANLLTGVYRPDAGTVVVGDEELTGRPAHRVVRAGVARTFQTPQLFGDQTVLENVQAGFAETGQLPLWRAALKPRAEYRRIADLEYRALLLLARVGLASDAR